MPSNSTRTIVVLWCCTRWICCQSIGPNTVSGHTPNHTRIEYYMTMTHTVAEMRQPIINRRHRAKPQFGRNTTSSVLYYSFPRFICIGCASLRVVEFTLGHTMSSVRRTTQHEERQACDTFAIINDPPRTAHMIHSTVYTYLPAMLLLYLFTSLYRNAQLL